MYSDINKKKLNNIKKARRKKGTIEYKARDLLRHAVYYGSIKKPLICSKCFKKDRIEGHHKDYKKPYEVIWLCPVCHRNVHGILFKISGGKRRSRNEN